LQWKMLTGAMSQWLTKIKTNLLKGVNNFINALLTYPTKESYATGAQN